MINFRSTSQTARTGLAAQQKLKRSETILRIDEVWGRFHGRSRLHHVEVLCAVLLESGCNYMAIENFKTRICRR